MSRSAPMCHSLPHPSFGTESSSAHTIAYTRGQRASIGVNPSIEARNLLQRGGRTGILGLDQVLPGEERRAFQCRRLGRRERWTGCTGRTPGGLAPGRFGRPSTSRETGGP